MVRRPDKKRQGGFSLIELLVVIALLSIVMGAVFEQINSAQLNSNAEQAKLDMFQEAREFMDQMTRDLHASGYPSWRNFQTGQLGSVIEQQSQYVAVGLVKVGPGTLWFEGDVDGTGQVSMIRYDLDTSDANNWCLRRLQAPKPDKTDPLADTIGWQVEVQNVQNGSAENPIFEAYSGTSKVAWPADGNLDFTNDAALLATVDMIKVTMSVQSKHSDVRTGQKHVITLVSTAHIENCSLAHDGKYKSCE